MGERSPVFIGKKSHRQAIAAGYTFSDCNISPAYCRHAANDQPNFDGNASISGLIRSSGSGNTMIEDLPLLDMSAIVCR
jgi:hypothetical protein